MARIYGKRFDGKVFEIQNWAREKPSDALVMQPLSHAQETTLHRLRAKGCTDSQIWRHLHPGLQRPDQPMPPRKKPSQFKVAIKTLATEQLVWLLEQLMDKSVESLSKMSREDLVTLAKHIGGGDQINISFGEQLTAKQGRP